MFVCKRKTPPTERSCCLVLCVFSFLRIHSLACLDVVHHLQVEVVFGALQDQRAAHVGRGVVEVEDDIVGVWGSFGPKHPVDLLRSLHLVGKVVSFWGTSGHNSS